MKSHLSEVYKKVLRQHAEIRARLHDLDAQVSAATASPLALNHLRVSLQRLASLFVGHLTYEEEEVAPHLRSLDPSGARERSLFAEHAEQRMTLERICAIAEDEEIMTRELAGEVYWLSTSLLADMAKEDAEVVALQELVDRGQRLAG